MAVSYFGPQLHLFCQRGAWTEAGLSEALRGLGLAVRGVERVAVRLEDVFIRLAQRQGEK